ncbi:anaerobic benzoate catabolism transcriptional regulator [compost metagenome]
MDSQRNIRNPIDAEVGARLKELRVQNRMTQVDLATALGVTFQQVQKYEKGQNRVAASTLAKAAAALNCKITDFYQQDTPSTPEPADALLELSDLYHRMATRQREALLTTARALVEIQR